MSFIDLYLRKDLDELEKLSIIKSNYEHFVNNIFYDLFIILVAGEIMKILDK